MEKTFRMAEEANVGIAQVEAAYYKNKRDLYLRIYSWVKDREVALDILQDTYVAMLRTAKNGNVFDDIEPYLFTVARRKITDYMRGKITEKHSHTELRGDLDVKIEQDPVQDFDNQAQAQADLEIILNMLSPEAADIMKMAYIDELSTAEIATKLGIKKSTIDQRICRTLQRIRKLLNLEVKTRSARPSVNHPKAKRKNLATA